MGGEACDDGVNVVGVDEIERDGVDEWFGAVAEDGLYGGARVVDASFTRDDQDDVVSVCDQGSKALFVWTRAGDFPHYAESRQDDTHLSPARLDLGKVSLEPAKSKEDIGNLEQASFEIKRARENAAPAPKP